MIRSPGWPQFSIVACALLLALASLPGAATAANQTVNLTFSTPASTDVSTWLGVFVACDPCEPDGIGGQGGSLGDGVAALIHAKASISAPATVGLQYTPADLRHGGTLDLADTLSYQQGTVTVDYSVTGSAGFYDTILGGTDESCGGVWWAGPHAPAQPSNGDGVCNDWAVDPGSVPPVPFGPITGTVSFPCTLPLPGDTPVQCSSTQTTVLDLTPATTTLESQVGLNVTAQVNSTGVSSLRIATVNGGSAIPNQTLGFLGATPSTVPDPIAISCAQPAGSDLLYSLTGNTYGATSLEPGLATGQLVDATLGIQDHEDNPFASFDQSFEGFGSSTQPAFTVAPDVQVDLGPVLKTNVPPTADAGGPYSGNEGSPIVFDGSNSSGVCAPTLRWDFSDGGVAFGMHPQHTFEAPGVYSGELTATDADGNTATTTFSVGVANLPPVANAGPDVSTEWGVPLALNGSAVDPGANEQSDLSYRWSFGDGSPSASGGASVSHNYTSPGTYTATLTACDPENACGSSTAQVIVKQRTTTIAYTGPSKANPSKTITLTASLVDDLGQPIAGRRVSFTLGGQTIGATTAASGTASASLKLNQKQGAYTLSVVFAGDTKYTAGTDTETFTIGP